MHWWGGCKRESRDRAVRYNITVFTGVKGTYVHPNHLANGLPNDKRSALHIAITKEALIHSNCNVRWISGNSHQFADAMPKEKGNGDLIRAIMKKWEVHHSRFMRSKATTIE